MSDRVTIMLPSSISNDDMAAITQELKEVESIESVKAKRPPVTRSVDPATLKTWIEVAIAVAGLVSAALPLIKRIVAMIRNKGIIGAKIKLPGGAEISVDNATSEEIEKIFATIKRK
jgi:hypothetical protein